MKHQMRAEWIKLRSTRVLSGLLAVHVAVTLLQLSLLFVNAGRLHTPSLGTTESVLRMIASSSYGAYVALVLGLLLVATEFRHKTISGTYLVQPHRAKVLGAKAVLGAASGAGIALAGLLATALVSFAWLGLNEVPLDLLHSRYLMALIGTVAVGAVYGAMGVGLGAIVPNSTAAIAGVVGYGIVVENLVIGLAFSDLLRWLPGGAATAIVGVKSLPGAQIGWLAAGGVLAAYALAVTALGFLATTRRDVV